MKKHKLNPQKTMRFFEKSLKEVNKISDSILAVLKTQPGDFYSFLPEHCQIDEIHEFDSGGKTRCLRLEVGGYLSDLLKSDKTLSCVFDDFNADFPVPESDDFYKKHGFHYENQVYYFVRSGVEDEVIIRCLRYSGTNWHSLCVVSDVSEIELVGKSISEKAIDEICANAVFVMIEAYDAESYISWEKSPSSRTTS
jgi:hypothetical protein